MPATTQWDAAGELAASRHGVLTRRQAAEQGVSADVIRRLIRLGHLREPVPGVLAVVGAPDTWRQRLRVATLASNAAGIAGFRSAASLHQLDGYPPGPLELLVPNRRRIPVRSVVCHRGPIEAIDRAEVDGIACTSVARTLCDLGSVDGPGRVRVGFESAWRNGCDLSALRAAAERLHRPGQSGTRVLLELLDDAERHRRPTESALEVRVERILADITGLVRQYTIRDRYGRFVARVDFAIPELRIAIEAHSRRHHFGPQRESADAMREAALLAQGWIVRYVVHAECSEPGRLRSSIAALIASRSTKWGSQSAG